MKTRKLPKAIYPTSTMEFVEWVIYLTNIWFGIVNIAGSPDITNESGLFSMGLAVTAGALPFMASIIAVPLMLFWHKYRFQQSWAAATMLLSVFGFFYGALINIGVQGDIFGASTFLALGLVAGVVFLDIRVRDRA